MYICVYVCVCECMYVCMYVCVYVCMYVCVYVCIMYVCVFVVVYIQISCNIDGDINAIPFFEEVFRKFTESCKFTKCNDVFKLSVSGFNSTPDSSNMKEEFFFTTVCWNVLSPT
jgi:hypothetical protein